MAATVRRWAAGRIIWRTGWKGSAGGGLCGSSSSWLSVDDGKSMGVDQREERKGLVAWVLGAGCWCKRRDDDDGDDDAAEGSSSREKSGGWLCVCCCVFLLVDMP